MKVYVEKLPKGCLSCPYIVDKGDYDLCAIKDCVIDDAFKYIDKRKNLVLCSAFPNIPNK